MAGASPVDAVLTTADFVECYRVHYSRVIRALCLAGADPSTAEDLAQEAFARALARWSRVCRGANPAGYVYLSAFRILRRQQGRRSGGSGPEVESAAPGDADTALSITVEGVLAAMPPRRRQCAVLCIVLDFSAVEAGRMLGLAPGTVRKHLDVARDELRRACR